MTPGSTGGTGPALGVRTTAQRSRRTQFASRHLRCGHADSIVYPRVGCEWVRACDGTKQAEMNRIGRQRSELFRELCKVTFRKGRPAMVGVCSTDRALKQVNDI